MHNTEVLAVVGNRKITRGDVDVLIKSLHPQTAAQFQSEEGVKSLVKELVNQELLYLDSVESGIDKDEECQRNIERAMSNVIKQYALNKLLNGIVVTEGEIEGYYKSNKTRFVSSPSVKASHILVDDLQKAQEIAQELKAELSFEETAKKYSTCPSSDNGGDLGYFSKGRMVPEFEKVAFETKCGQISEPFDSPFGYHILKVYDRKEGTQQPLEEVREQIANELLAHKQQQVYQKKVDMLKGKYDIKVNV
jgi:peptidyl-prolyl cis-trans isomerase C